MADIAMRRRPGSAFCARVWLLSAALVGGMLVLPTESVAWDAGTTSRVHAEGSGGENPIAILDTRPKWAVSVDTNASRVSDCPAGYTNNGATCGRGADTLSAPSLAADCPAGYTNTGFNCTRGADTLSAASLLATCPAGYTNTGVSCYRNPISTAHRPRRQTARRAIRTPASAATASPTSTARHPLLPAAPAAPILACSVRWAARSSARPATTSTAASVAAMCSARAASPTPASSATAGPTPWH